LRLRRSDIAELALHFVQEFARNGLGAGNITAEALGLLGHYDWPGNVRELRNVIERAAVLSRGAAIDIPQLPVELTPATLPASDQAEAPVSDLDLNQAIDAVESRLIAEALRRAGGNKTRAASLLNISVRSLWHKLDKYKPA
ncbi:MAG TPA: helix-turn-helix domain-containing protein, partial [Nevskia sp.]|nr:helix-turn-helix domain-containing protein [Nevskia sp.]